MDMEKKTGRKLGKTGAIGIALALVLLIALGVGGASGAFGLLKDTTAGVEAKYTPAEVVCAVTETTGEGTTSYSVTTDSSTTDAYLRAAIVLNWSNGDSIVYDPDKQFPEPTVNSNWTLLQDGYYYYNGAVAPDTTVPFFTVNTTDGLQVVVMADAIQAKPKDASADAWGFVYGDSGWTAANP